MSLSKSETDVILNKANVALARSQWLVASWLPPRTQEELDNSKSEEELQKEEDEIFTAVPETLGIGAPLPSKAANGSWKRVELDSNDKLRKQLLGKNYKKVVAARTGAPHTLGKPGMLTSHSQSTARKEYEEDDDEEDGGRTAMVTKSKIKSRKRKAVLEAGQDYDDNATSAGKNEEDTQSTAQGITSSSRPIPRPQGRKKATSILDEILADRSKKRKKK
ncbi:hypothetical protein EYZ11_004763 [Aspergillus tanneri]|uniref:Uncharacterized protein n=1 Tax=Aspergillus tanneri TaxID=1220188 RepID=A0A4S3JJR7_9EURO|nr:uncharacterized protein ATNIH1004_002737 [Aspergillus tanneri]KAA8650056.1 hypothetical protein ATNIH1004_002737 [Aspergillus tanneri]THC95766.1 hypothetical protein EYZ11_004763 [Aspergillus tanneri]